MKKILFFIGTLEKGGAERVVSILSNELVKKEYEVEILKYYNSNNSYELSDKVIVNSVEENTNTTNIISNLKWIKNYFNNKHDIIISFLAPFNMLALWANKNNKTPIIVADRNDPNKIPAKQYLRTIRNILYSKYSDGVVLQTKENEEYFKNIKNKTTVINNPVVIDVDTDNVKKENVIVSVGRLIPQKNQLMMIDAFNEIVKEYPDYKLIIYGEGNSREELTKHISNLNLDGKVLLPGNTDDILNKIKTAKLFLLTSNYEGMPNALIEAMCLGLPVISTKVSGANQLIENGNNGYLVNDLNDLIDKIKTILSNELLQEKMSKNTKQTKELFNVDTITQQWIDFINKYIK